MQWYARRWREGPRRGWPKASGIVLVRSPLLTSHTWRELVSSGRFVCRCHVVFLWCYVCFVSYRFCLYAFENATLRSIVLRYAGVPIALRFFFLSFFSLFGDVGFSLFFFHFRFFSVWRVRRTFFTILLLLLPLLLLFYHSYYY